jgi:hypothetical protein
MNTNKAKFDPVKNEVLVENNAQTIYDHLNELEKNSPNYVKRWFWELLQNAKDSVENDSKVSVKVNLNGEKLEFRHTGDPFNEHEIIHLIFHGSSKTNAENKTGRFGTGFMSTHLLSRKVNITGKLEDNTYFKFDLDREAKDVQQQQANLEKSYDLFTDSNRQENYADDSYNTIFSYDLSEESLKIAKDGIKQLRKILPFVLAFNDKIQDIDIIENNESISIKRGELDKIQQKENHILSQEIIHDDHVEYVVFVKLEDCDIAVLLEKRDEKINVVDLNDEYPKLFYDFPLFGTEKFGLPIIINSTKFDIQEKRDGIFLGLEDKEHPSIAINKNIIAQSIDSLSLVIKFISEYGVQRIYNLFKVTSPFEYPWLQKEWLENLYKSKIGILLETECLNIKERSFNLNGLVIPYSTNNNHAQFYTLVTDLVKDSTPEYNEIEEWKLVARGLSKLEKKELSNYQFIVDEKKLCKIIEDQNILININKIVHKSDMGEDHELTASVKWFNNFYDILTKEQTALFSSNYKIIPNQNGVLVKREPSRPSIDIIGNEAIKSVAANFGWDIKSDLVYPGIYLKEGILQTVDMKETLDKIQLMSNSITDEQLNDVNIRKALIHYFQWLIENKKEEYIKDVFVIVEKGRISTEINYSKKRLSVDKLIVPSTIWDDKYSLYKEIISKRYVLIDEYSDYLTADDFRYLKLEDLIFISPLINKKNPTKSEIKLLLKKTDSYSRLFNEKDEMVDVNIEYTDIAYLTRSEDNILAKTADSFKSAKSLLNFLLSQVLENDPLFNKTTEFLVNDEKISISNCLWVSRLRDTQWVPVKSIDTEKQNNSERPSVANITELIRDEEDILKNINTKNASLFFNYLGISSADIIRNTLSNDEEKLNWDMAFSQLLSNKSIDAELAVEMLGDPRLQAVYLQQRKEREQIKANQDLGYLFESIFRTIFESDEYKEQGFLIERTAFGSDYGVIYEQDIADGEGSEVIFKIGQILIELKATSKSYAEMTPLQAETATKNIDKYVLAVLPLKGFEITEVSLKENSRFIVNIAEPLVNRYKEYQSYNQKKIISTSEQMGVKLNIEEGNIRYQVKSELWENNSLCFDEFINWLKKP